MPELSSKVRFRLEREAVLICDLRTLSDYEVGLEYLPLLEQLRRGLPSTHHLSASDLALIADFGVLGFFDARGTSPGLWERMEFE